MNRSAFLLPVVVVAALVVISAVFTVDERERALVLQFGEVVTVKEDPGLAFKIPLIQEVVKYDKRILALETQSLEVTPADDRRLVVDAFARWRIQDVVKFRRAVGASGIDGATSRLQRIINAEMRAVLGSVDSGTVLSADRVALMNQIRDKARVQALSLGVEIVDVRIKRADLPEQNLSATFARMRAEREREAADEIARGKEAAQRVRALADRTVVETVSIAQKEADIIRGEADANRNANFAEAFGKDPEFFVFYRSLNAYEASLQGSNTTLVLSPDSEFFDYLKTDRLGE